MSKFAVRLIFMTLTLVLSNPSFAMGCWGIDKERYRSTRYERETCTGSGYCNMYDYNPSTGRYEYFYGYHSACPGHRERQIFEITCERADGSTYLTIEEGFWSGCYLQPFFDSNANSQGKMVFAAWET